MFAAAPLLALPVIGYNIFVFMFLPGGRHTPGVAQMAQAVFTMPGPRGDRWPVTLGDLVVFVSLTILIIEQLKTTTSRHVVIINQSLAIALFIVCLIEFLLFPAFANSAFFLLSFMVLLDVLTGLVVNIRQELEAARR